MLKNIILFLRALPKTLLFNFYYFPFFTAIRLPVFVSHRVWINGLCGKVTLNEPKCGGIRIGFGDVGIFDQHRSRAIWQMHGIIEFVGAARIGHGSRISVGKNGYLKIGNECMITAESALIASKRIIIGDNVLISWDVLIMDTDFHDICDADGQTINAADDITIQDHVWIGCRAMILKGVNIPPSCIIAAAATVTKSPDRGNTVIVGAASRIAKTDVYWKL